MKQTTYRTTYLESIASASARFESISLEEIGTAALMDRVDLKYLAPVEIMPGVMERLVRSYRVLEVKGTRLCRYRSTYFDTPDLRFYHAHHGDRAPRFKVRVRSYIDTDEHYLEIKIKTNKDRTLKTRLSIGGYSENPIDLLRREEFFGVREVAEAARLEESVVIEFTRVTLVHRNLPERLTVDLNLTVRRNSEIRSFPAVAVAEVKQERQSPSQFREAMREYRIRPGAVSKYCMGIASLENGAKKNRFKQILRRLEVTGNEGLNIKAIGATIL